MTKKKIQVTLTYEVEGDAELAAEDIREETFLRRGIPYLTIASEYRYELLPGIKAEVI